VKALVPAVFNRANQEGITDRPNPAVALKCKLIQSRERFPEPADSPQFFSAVADSPLADFFLLAILIGARRSNVQEMRRQDIDAAGGVKAGAQIVPLKKKAKA
jgi:integrase